jgi:conjugal transfer pilus assembly protein TraD
MSSLQAYNYEDPFRPIYEYFAIGTWVACSLVSLIAIGTTPYPKPILILFATVAGVMAARRTVSAIRLWRGQRALQGIPVTFMTPQDLLKINPPESKSLFLGFGFRWSQAERQLVHSIIRNDPDKLTVDDSSRMGQAWLHGIGGGTAKEVPIMIPLDHTAGHVLLVGTTRAGKSRFLDTIISQAVARGESVIVWDPKGDIGLKESLRKAALRHGGPDKYIYFHPAFPELSARIDPLKNFNRATELATRVAVLIPSETGADPFTAYSQMLLTVITEALLLANIKPSLNLYRKYVSTGLEPLVCLATRAFLDKNVANWEAAYKPYKEKMKEPTLYYQAISFINYYNEQVAAKHPSTTLENLHAQFGHERTHAAKMTASLMPVLNMLTSGTLGPLLSPDSDDPTDRRPITDFARIIRNQQCCYIGLDSLSDNMVGSAIGSMFLSDMTAVSGDRYNYQIGDAPVTLIIDEASEVVSDKMVQLLNKAGGSNIRLVIATQTFADFAARVGSLEKARMVLGNLNNTIVLRTIDGATQEYIAESMPATYVRHIEYGQATDVKTSNAFDFGYRISESVKETEVPLVDAPIMGILPNLEFFAKVSGGTVYKGRIPILDTSGEEVQTEPTNYLIDEAA